MSHELTKELEYFRSQLPELLQHSKGQFAVIKDEELAGTFSEFDSAVRFGIETFGNTAFLVRKIVAEDSIAQSPALVLGLLSAHP